MVTRRTLVILLGLALAALVLAGWAWQSTRATLVVAEAGKPLLPALRQRADDVARIEITRGEDTITLRRKGKAWVVGEAAYPVEPKEVRKLLLGLMNMKLVAPMTAKPEKYKYIHVDDPNPQSLATRVVLKDARGRVIADVIVGREEVDRLGSGTEAQFARRAGEKQSWLVEGLVRVPVLRAQWVNTALLALPAEKLMRIELRGQDGEMLVLERPAPGKPFALKDKPETAKLKEKAIGAIVSTLTEMTFTDVRKRREKPRATARAVLTFADGLKIALAVAKDGKVHWLRPDVLAAGKDKKLAQGLKQRFAGREFAVYDSVAERIGSRLEDVIEAEVENLDKTGETGENSPDSSQ